MLDLLLKWAELASSVVTVLGVGFALWQLRSWRRELIGKTKFQVAHQIAVLAFQFRDELRYARSPIVLPGELADRATTRVEGSYLPDNVNDIMVRLAPVRAVMTKLDAARWEAGPLLDKDDLAGVEHLLTLYGNLFYAAQTYFDSSLRPPPAESRDNPSLDMGHLRSLIFRNIPEDEFGKKVDCAVEALTTRLAKYLR